MKIKDAKAKQKRNQQATDLQIFLVMSLSCIIFMTILFVG